MARDGTDLSVVEDEDELDSDPEFEELKRENPGLFKELTGA